MLGLPAVSISGPGIAYSSVKFDVDAVTSARPRTVAIVPDRDLVPKIDAYGAARCAACFIHGCSLIAMLRRCVSPPGDQTTRFTLRPRRLCADTLVSCS